jgi:hypothetical protein
MFSPGQKVWHRNGQRSGTVLECDGDRVYLAQDNGVEIDFPASDLTATPPTNASPAAVAIAAHTAIPTRTLTPRDITPEHERVLATIPSRTLQAIAAVFDRTPKRVKFNAMDTAGKLNAVTVISAVPYRIMRQYLGRPGELGLLMGKGLADSSKAP